MRVADAMSEQQLFTDITAFMVYHLQDLPNSQDITCSNRQAVWQLHDAVQELLSDGQRRSQRLAPVWFCAMATGAKVASRKDPFRSQQ